MVNVPHNLIMITVYERRLKGQHFCDRFPSEDRFSDEKLVVL